MNEAHKSELKNALLDQLGLSECICLISFKVHIMFLKGGWGGRSLLQRLPWTVGSTFDEISQSFKHYFLNNYGTAENITVDLTEASSFLLQGEYTYQTK